MTRLIILIIIAILLEIYFYKKYLNSIRFLFKIDLTKYKWHIRFIIGYLNIYIVVILIFWIETLFSGERFRFILENNIWDYFILYPFWVSIMLVIQSALILLPLEILKLFIRLFLKNKHEQIKKISYVISFITISFFVVYVPARVIFDYKYVEVREVTYKLNAAHQSLEKLKIIFISDVQADWYTNDNRLNNFIAKINDTNPDLVLIGGDIITNTPNYITKSAEYLGKIHSKYGVFTCVGDHDNWAYRGNVFKSRNEVKNALASNRVTMLDNENLFLNIDSSTVGISFVTESYSERISNRLLDSLSQQIADKDLSLLVTHQPTDRIINRSVENGINIMLAGHTHGGQITFLFPFINLTPTLLETKHVHGDFWYDDLLLIVNRGLGMSLVPIRYNSAPEINVINLEINK